jgi:hypothetical protein
MRLSRELVLVLEVLRHALSSFHNCETRTLKAGILAGLGWLHWCYEPPCDGHVCDRLRGPTDAQYASDVSRSGYPRGRSS